MASVREALKARDIMVHEPVCVEPSTTLRQLAGVLVENEISGAPVVDREGHVVGIVSKTDLIRHCLNGRAEIPPAYLCEVLLDQPGGDDGDVIPEQLDCVEDIMTRDPVTVRPDAPASEVARLMYGARIHRIIVIDERRYPVGIITSLDIAGAFAR
jgi:CBS domain-containing protein